MQQLKKELPVVSLTPVAEVPNIPHAVIPAILPVVAHTTSTPIWPSMRANKVTMKIIKDIDDIF